MTKNREDNIIRTLTYVDSEGELSPHDHDGDFSVNGSSPLSSPYANDADRSSEFLEMDLPPLSPCPVPRPRRRPMKSRRYSPIPFASYQDEGHEGDVDEATEQRVPNPGTEFASPACPVSPPHRRLRALRLFDTPHTPKSLLQKARRRRNTDDKKRQREERVEANFNPFTPNNNRPGSATVNGKRNRSQFERYVVNFRLLLMEKWIMKSCTVNFRKWLIRRWEWQCQWHVENQWPESGLVPVLASLWGLSW